MSLVVDASVVVKWFLPEPDSHLAERALMSGEALLAPELVLAEVGNAVWRRTLTGEVEMEDAGRIVDRAASAFTALVPLAEIGRAAMQAAVTLKHPIYDCFYLALAAREGAALVTADRRLRELGDRMGVRVELLA